MLSVFYIIGALAVCYFLFTLVLTYLVHQIPRRPVYEKPDWGAVTDTRIPARDGGWIEVWRVDVSNNPKGIVVFAHGWGRNRDRMVYRARLFGAWGFTTVMHSARDHGGSSPRRCMNAMKFCEDIEAVLDWIHEPVMLYGHSAGAAGAVIAAARNPDKIKLLFLEACYARTKEALLNLYRWFNPIFGDYFAPMVLFWMNLFYRGGLDKVSPVRLARRISMPVMIIHGAEDRRFPVKYAKELQNAFAFGQASLFIAPGAGHSDSSLQPGYKDHVKQFLDRHEEVFGL
jgi:uncharacterized protein